jgi:hypothetical protein
MAIRRRVSHVHHYGRKDRQDLAAAAMVLGGIGCVAGGIIGLSSGGLAGAVIGAFIGSAIAIKMCGG